MDIIRLGDTTSHGGTVIEAFGQTDLNGKPMAGVGHQVVCPLCKGTFPITEGCALLDVNGVPGRATWDENSLWCQPDCQWPVGRCRKLKKRGRSICRTTSATSFVPLL